MEVKINQVVLHLLDPGASEPVLSDRAMDMDADLYEYYTATLERAFASDEVKNCRFLPDSAFAAEMAQNQDFIDLSRRIAGVIFEQMLQYQAIPAGDLAVVDFTADPPHRADGQWPVQQHGAAAHAAARHAQGRRSRAY